MIEGHEHDEQAAQAIGRREPLARCGLGPDWLDTSRAQRVNRSYPFRL